MDTARQFLRWSIPASTLLLILALCGALNIVATSYFKLAAGAPTPLTAPEVAAAALLTIPLGFLIYQHYYRAEFRVSRSGIGTRDRGWSILKDLPRAEAEVLIPTPPTLTSNVGIFELAADPSTEAYVLYPALVLHLLGRQVTTTLHGPSRFRRRVLVPAIWQTAVNDSERRSARRDFASDSRTRWRLVRMLIVIVADSERGRALAVEYTNLSDIYHALGATRTAVFMGGLAAPAVSFLLGPEHNPWIRLGVGFVVSAACILMYFTLWRNREQVLEHLLDCVRVGLCALLRPSPK